MSEQERRAMVESALRHHGYHLTADEMKDVLVAAGVPVKAEPPDHCLRPSDMHDILDELGAPRQWNAAQDYAGVLERERDEAIKREQAEAAEGSEKRAITDREERNTAIKRAERAEQFRKDREDARAACKHWKERAEAAEKERDDAHRQLAELRDAVRAYFLCSSITRPLQNALTDPQPEEGEARFGFDNEELSKRVVRLEERFNLIHGTPSTTPSEVSLMISDDELRRTAAEIRWLTSGGSTPRRSYVAEAMEELVAARRVVEAAERYRREQIFEQKGRGAVRFVIKPVYLDEALDHYDETVGGDGNGEQ